MRTENALNTNVEIVTENYINTRMIEMVDNISFLSHPHFCLICTKQIDMNTVKKEILNQVRYYHEPEHLPPIKQDDPIAVRDHGNDIEMVCSTTCFAHYIMTGISNHYVI
jgi:DNA-directed RNA polymerase subunit H (RpoH/RPB5)